VLRALQQRFGPASGTSLPIRGAELLLQINDGPSEAVWQRYHELSARRDAEILTPQEHEELIGLSQFIESSDMKRLEYIVRLAELRGVNLRTVRTQLGRIGRDNA
jgi:hypothetical protein